MRVLAALPMLLTAGCVGSTGGESFQFDAYAAGPESARSGSYAFVNGRGYAVELSRARLHVGAVYLNSAVQTSVASDTSCTLAGIYVAEVTSGLDVDLLSGTLQRFPGRGSATSDRALSGEVWLTGGAIDAESDATVILDVAGVAAKDGTEYPFGGTLTIGQNRALPPPNPALPGARPICKQRVVTPIPLELTGTPGDELLLRVDPAGMFSNVDFSTLETAQDGGVRFADDSRNQASDNLYNGLRASRGVYSFDWR